MNRRLPKMILFAFALAAPVISLRAAVAQQDCETKHFRARGACGAAYDKCYCQKCPTTAKCGGATYGCTGLNPCRDARTTCSDKARGEFNACARAASVPSFDQAGQRVGAASGVIPGRLQPALRGVGNAVADLKKQGKPAGPGLMDKIRDAVRAILRGPEKFKNALNQLNPVYRLKEEEQKAWTGN